MNQDKWTQQLHDKLAEREVAPPDDLWADIEAALPTSPKASQKPRGRFVPLRRWAVAASLALLIAGGGYLYWQAPTTESPTTAAPTSSIPHIPQPERAQADSATHEDNSIELLAEQLTEPVPISHKVIVPSLCQPSIDLMAQTSVEDSVVETIGKTDDVELTTDLDEKFEMRNERTDNFVMDNSYFEGNHISHLSPLTSHLSITLYASNGFTDLQRANGVRMDDALAAQYDFETYLPYRSARTRAAEPIYLVGYEERQKHYQSIAFGLSVSYPLLKNLSLSTGITYTRLRSDFTSIINGSSISQKQTLHYLGVPLSAQYRLFHYGGLNVYLSGGAEADYNIKAHLASEGVTQHLNRDRWQFSVQGGVGLQYDILPQLGLYAEPGVKYYFDNGSRMRNFFKDQPTGFNLQFGLRLNIIK